jgi:hypothetical protein
LTRALAILTFFLACLGFAAIATTIGAVRDGAPQRADLVDPQRS